MRKLLIFIFVTLGLFIFIEKGFSTQDKNILNKENEINLIENKLYELQKENKTIISNSEILIKEIESLKTSKNKSIWHRYMLEEKLKESQEFSDRIKSLNRNIGKVKVQYKKGLKEIIKLYDNTIKSTVNQLKKQESIDIEDIELLRDLYNKKSAWKMKIEDEIFNAVTMVDVEINPLDGPEEIDEKADILMDIAEDLRKNIDVLNKKKEELEEEKEIRAEMGEFIKEIHLFDEREKGLTSPVLGKVAAATEDLNNYHTDYISNFWGDRINKEIGRDYLFRLFEEYEIFKDNKFSDEGMDNLSHKYDLIISKLEAKSEEIEQKAKIFYQKAEELKKIENNYK